MTLKKGLLSVCLVGLMMTVLGILQIQSIIPAPHVVFTTLTGKKIELVSLKGQPVLINFWATDCPSCIKEIPDLIELYHQFQPQGLEIIAIAMYYDPPNHVVAMSDAKQLPYPVALDLTAAHAQAFGQVQLIPSTFLISPSGLIVMQKTGRFDLTEMKQQITTLLKG